MGNTASQLVDADASSQGHHHSPRHAPSSLFAGPGSSTEGSLAHRYRIPGAFDDIISNSATTTLPASIPRPCLGDLPEELLLNIVEHVGNDSSSDMQTLLSLCRVDRRFRRLTTPYIYELYDTRYGNPFLFIRTLVISPELAAYVKYVSWGKGVTLVSNQGWIFRTPQNPPTIIGGAEYKISSDDRYSTMSRLLGIGTPHAIEIASRFWYHDTNTYLDSIFLTAILMLVPNIVSLDLDQINKSSGGFQRSAMHSWTDLIRFSSVHSFTRLTCVNILTPRGVDLFPLFVLPSMRSIELSNWSTYRNDMSYAPSQISQVEYFIVRNSCADTEALAMYISACRKLRTVFYEHSPAAWNRGLNNFPFRNILIGPPPFQAAKLYSALHQHRRSLRHLAVILGKNVGSQYPYMVENFEFMAEFEVLFNVLLPSLVFPIQQGEFDAFAQMLMRLPPNVQNLTLQVPLSVALSLDDMSLRCKSLVQTIFESRNSLCCLSLHIETPALMLEVWWDKAHQLVSNSGRNLWIYNIPSDPSMPRSSGQFPASTIGDIIQQWEVVNEMDIEPA